MKILTSLRRSKDERHEPPMKSATRRSIPLPDPEALGRRKGNRPLPWALIRFLATVVVLALALWLAIFSGYLDDYAPQLKQAWSVLVNQEEGNRSAHQMVFTCPMHPEILSDKPGDDCPICGMDLVPAEEKPSADAGHQQHAPAEPDAAPDVSIEPRMLNNLGVKTETVEVRTLSREVRFTGEVAVNDSSTEVLQS